MCDNNYNNNTQNIYASLKTLDGVQHIQMPSPSLHVSHFPSVTAFVPPGEPAVGVFWIVSRCSFPLSNKADNHLFLNHISIPVMRGVSQPLEYDP